MLLPRHSITSQPAAPIATAIRFTSASSNAESSVFACATPSGFLVQRIQPYGEAYRRDLGSPGMRIAIPVADTSLVLLVGAERSGLFPSTALTLWDDQWGQYPDHPGGLEPNTPPTQTEGKCSASAKSQPYVPSEGANEDAECAPTTASLPLDLASSPGRPGIADAGLTLDRDLSLHGEQSVSSNSHSSTASLVSAASLSASRHQFEPANADPEVVDESCFQTADATWVRDFEPSRTPEGPSDMDDLPGSPVSETMHDFSGLTQLGGQTITRTLEHSLVSVDFPPPSPLQHDVQSSDEDSGSLVEESEQVEEPSGGPGVGDIPDWDEDDAVHPDTSPESSHRFTPSPQASPSQQQSPIPRPLSPVAPHEAGPSPPAPEQVLPLPIQDTYLLQDAEPHGSPCGTTSPLVLSEEAAVERAFTPRRSPTTSCSVSVEPEANMATHRHAFIQPPVQPLQDSGLTGQGPYSSPAPACQETLTSSQLTNTSHATIPANDPPPVHSGLMITSDEGDESALTQRMDDLQLSHESLPTGSALFQSLGGSSNFSHPTAHNDAGSESGSGSDPALFMSVLDPPTTGRPTLLVPDTPAGGRPLSLASSRASFASLSPHGTPAQAPTSLPSAQSAASTLQAPGSPIEGAHPRQQASALLATPGSPGAPSVHPPPPTSTTVEESDSGDSSIGQGRCAPERRQSSPALTPELGSVVAQLEFGERVRNVYTHLFSFGPSRSHRAHRSPPSHAPYLRRPAQSCVAVVIILKTKAVILEIGPFPVPQHDSGGDEFAPLPSWKVQERLVIPISPTPQGLGAITQVDGYPGQAIVALPGRQAGLVQLIPLPIGPEHGSRAAHGPTAIIAAHDSALAALSLSACGTLLATMSDKGTLVRIWSTVHPPEKHKHRERLRIGLSKVRELRRGLDTAKIHDVCFSPDARWLAVVSETGTIHFFSLLVRPGTKAQPSRTSTFSAPAKGKSKLSSLSRVVPPSMLPRYFQSEWSTALFRLRLSTFASTSEGRPSLRSSGAGGVSMQTGYGDVNPPPPADWVKVASKGKETTAAGPTREGQWASLRQRISSARRGEAAIDERVVLGWAAARPDEAEPYHLLAATSAGHFYRIALDPPSTEQEPESGSDAANSETQDEGKDEDLILSMYRSSTSASVDPPSSTRVSSTKAPRAEGKGKSPAATVTPDADEDALSGSKKCHLEEYRTFGRSDVFGP